MRHPHGLRAATGAIVQIGDAYQGGYFAGYISHTADGVATHGLIVAPDANSTTSQFKTTNTDSPGTGSTYDGLANTNSMNNASHPAAQYCAGLSIGGFTDWYLPALYELDIAYQNLKPTTQSNDTIEGINNYSVPKRTVNRTSGNPAQTSVAIFQSGGAEDFNAVAHMTSTQTFSSSLWRCWRIIFNDGRVGREAKVNNIRVRAFRRFTL